MMNHAAAARLPAASIELARLPAKLRELYEFWDRKRAPRAMPFRRDIDVIELQPWFGHLMLLDVIDGGGDYAYRVYGSVLASYFHRDLTGRRVSSLPDSVQDVVRAEYGHVVAGRTPLATSRRRSALYSSMEMARLVLPLTVGGDGVDMLLVGVYKAG